MNDDIRVIEILRKHGAKATFNLNPATHGAVRQGGHNDRLNKVIQRLARNELDAVYEGFTIANHSMTHPWPTKIALDDWRQEVVDGRKVLQDWFQQPILGFAYPFGDFDAATAGVIRGGGVSGILCN